MSKEKVRAEDLHRVLDAEVSKLRAAPEWKRWLDVAALLPTYGFGNLVLINLQMREASWLARARQWQQLGRRVDAGRGIRILTPQRSHALARDPRRHGGADGSIEDQVIGFRVGLVYDITATVGPPVHLPRPPAAADAALARRVWDGLAHDVAGDGYAVDVRPTGDGSEGFTDYGASRIVIADHLDDFRAVARLAHEVGHVRMHPPADPDAANGCMGTREVEAESVAYVVLARYGLSFDAESFDYIAHWARQADPEDPTSVVKATGVRVVKTARRLIDSMDKQLGAQRAPLTSAQVRPLDSASVTADVDGPAL